MITTNDKYESPKYDSMGIVPNKSDPGDWNPNHIVAYVARIRARDNSLIPFYFHAWKKREVFCDSLERLFFPLGITYEMRVIDISKTQTMD